MTTAKNVCPECGADLDSIDARKHARAHWEDVIPVRADNVEARKRQEFLFDLAQKQDEEKIRARARKE